MSGLLKSNPLLSSTIGFLLWGMLIVTKGSLWGGSVAYGQDKPEPQEMPPPDDPENMPPPPPPPSAPDPEGDLPPPASSGTAAPSKGPAGSPAKGAAVPGAAVPGAAANGAALKDSKEKGAASVPPGQELVSIDFPEPTEIKDIIKAVSYWTQKNVILDRNVNGKIQIFTPRRVTKEEAYQAFLSALNLLGLTTVETGKVIKIMPVRTAVKGNLKTILGSSWTPMTDEVITQIVPLKYIDAKEIQATLSRIVSTNSMIAYPPTNTLIISETGYKVRRILDIVELLDVQGQQAQVAIVPIRYAEAKSIADKVSEIFKNTSGSAKGAASSSYRSYKIMTDERTNSVIIFGPPRTIADVKALVRKFDIPLDDPSRQSTIHVRPLDYADAKKLAATLQALATANKPKTNVRRNLPPAGVNLPPPGVPMPKVDEPLSVADLGDDVKIAPEESSNSLLITGSHSAYQTINSLIRKLDLRRSQVFVEADILDINMDSGFNFQTSVFAGRGGPQSSSIATTWKAAPLGPLIAAQATQGAGANPVTNTAAAKEVAGVFAEDLTIGILSGKEIDIAGLGKFRPGALIRMLKSDGHTRILSSPSIMTLNNEDASFTVGQKIYFKSQESIPSGTGQVLASKPEKEDIDLTLSIKPNISHSNYVTMKIDLDANSLGSNIFEGLPAVNKRKSKQLVTVKNGQTVVISGLVQTTQIESYAKIPLLGDIPILGWLFRNSNIRNARSNLMIFLTPHIIHGADDMAAVYAAKLEERDQYLATIFGSRYADDDFYKMLPTKEDGTYVSSEMDKLEKDRREALLRQLYESSNPTANPQQKFKKAEDSKGEILNSKTPKDDAPVYVPLSGDGSGGGDVGGGGGGDMAPPPIEPPPEPEPSSGE